VPAFVKVTDDFGTTMFEGSGCPFKGSPGTINLTTGPWCHACPDTFTNADGIFRSTGELYNAIDDYLAAENPMTAISAVTYGFPIGTWDVSRVADFSDMFSGLRNSAAQSFNEDLSQWNVSSATDMSYMFGFTEAFNQDLSSWDVSHVTEMYGMFHSATAFNQDLCSWGQNVIAFDEFFGFTMFEGSGCPITDSPDSSNLAAGPWCQSCYPT
jgi:surface protein